MDPEPSKPSFSQLGPLKLKRLENRVMDLPLVATRFSRSIKAMVVVSVTRLSLWWKIS